MPGNVALYSNLPLPGSAYFASLGWATQTFESADDSSPSSKLVLEKAGLLVTINKMPSSQVEGHLAGFCRYIRSKPGEWADLCGDISRVETVLGVIIEPDWDAEGEAEELVWSLAEELRAFLFARDSVFHYGGEALLGPAAAS
jgi:hypothetical protein